jgi:hypothetical protein
MSDGDPMHGDLHYLRRAEIPPSPNFVICYSFLRRGFPVSSRHNPSHFPSLRFLAQLVSNTAILTENDLK